MSRCPLCFHDRGTASLCPHCREDGQPQADLRVLPSGTLLAGQYRIGKMLGHPGGFGITYLAWDEKLEMRIAIKEFFPPELAGRGRDGVSLTPHSERDRPLFEYGLQQFLVEARRVARFDHANIVQVKNFFQANGTGYLVMNYYDGQSLAAFLARQPGGRLGERLAVGVMMPVLDGLRTVHAAGMLHRDIDPSNIYVTTQGRIILLDFGAARTAMGEKSRSLSVILKPGYAPYEQYASTGKQGPWTDVYACAATLYRLVTGQVPPDAPGRILEDTLRPAHELNPDVSRELSAVLQRALALRPQGRPQSAEEFQQLLLGRRVPPPPPPPRVSEEPTRPGQPWQPSEPSSASTTGWQPPVRAQLTWGGLKALLAAVAGWSDRQPQSAGLAIVRIATGLLFVAPVLWVLSDLSYYTGIHSPVELFAEQPLAVSGVLLLPLFGGVALIAGRYSRIAALTLAVSILLMILGLGGSAWFALDSMGEDWVIALTLMQAAACLSLAVTGPDRYSLDAALARRRKSSP